MAPNEPSITIRDVENTARISSLLLVFMAHERPMRTVVVQNEESLVMRDGWPGKRGDQREDVESSAAGWPRSPW